MDTNDQKTLRDEFAMAALTGLMSEDIYTVAIKTGKPIPDFCASMAYEIADAMLKQRNK